MQPDVLVAHRDQLTEKNLPAVPNLLVLELDSAGGYQEITRVSGSDAFTATRPFGVRVVPAALLERLGRTPESSA